jgi:hypothetical protein
VATALPRRTVGVLSSLLLAALTVVGLSGPAHAEDGYQYWNYFHLENGSWAFSQVGPADYTPKDGTVEAFRYGTSTPSQGIEPRVDLEQVNFETVCAGQEAAQGQKRVAVVLDFGVEEGAGTPPEPRAECAVVDRAATTQQIVGEVAEVRIESSMLCAIDGYPATGCGAPVKNAEIPAEEEPVEFGLPAAAEETEATGADNDPAATEDDGNTWLLVGLAALVVLLAAVAFVMSRRKRTV